MNLENEYNRLYRRELIRQIRDLDTTVSSVSDRLAKLTYYLETLESFISNESEKELARFNKRVAESQRQDPSEFWAIHYPVHWNEIFRSNLRASFLALLISVAENEIQHATRHVEIITTHPFDKRAFKGSHFEKMQKYLTSVGGFTKPDKTEWDYAASVRRVRNVFVHNGGLVTISPYKSAVTEFAKTRPGLSIEKGFLAIGDEFCLPTLKKIESLLVQLREQVVSLCDLSTA